MIKDKNKKNQVKYKLLTSLLKRKEVKVALVTLASMLVTPMALATCGSTGNITGMVPSASLSAVIPGEAMQVSACFKCSGETKDRLRIEYVSGSCSGINYDSGQSDSEKCGAMDLTADANPTTVCRVKLLGSAYFGDKDTEYREFNYKQPILFPGNPTSLALGAGAGAYTITPIAKSSSVTFISKTGTCSVGLNSGAVTNNSVGECIIEVTAAATGIWAETKTFTGWQVTPEPDYDNDGFNDFVDNCINVKNGLAENGATGNQANEDGDAYGDACAHTAFDSDLDLIADLNDDGSKRDNCPYIKNGPNEAAILNVGNQTDTGYRDFDAANNVGDACDGNFDGDYYLDFEDNCPEVINNDQAPSNTAGWGSACTFDTDGDGIETLESNNVVRDVSLSDNCPDHKNANQNDLDEDGVGDVCEPDTDGDGHIDDEDNCPATANADQQDSDGNGVGDSCEMVFVSQSGTDPLDSNVAGECLSWASACATIEAGIEAAVTNNMTQVFVKAGEYKIKSPSTTINLVSGVSIAGGFAGTELRIDQANPGASPTIINGESKTESLLTASGLTGLPIKLSGLTVNAGGNATTAAGGGLNITDSDINLTNMKFTANEAINGGAINVAGTSAIEMFSVTFSDNKAATTAAAIYASGANVSLIIKNSEFSENNATTSAGAIAVHGATLIMENSNLNANTAERAGALQLDGSSSAEISLTTFKDNVANAVHAGAIRVLSTATLILNESEFENNSSAQFGGAISLETKATTVIDKSLFLTNFAGWSGGAIHLNKAAGILNINNSTFYANTTAGDGGAIRVSAGTANIGHATMVSNVAGSSGGAGKIGGAIAVKGGFVGLQNSLILANTAPAGNNIAYDTGTFIDADYNIVGFNGDAGLSGVSLAGNSFTAEAAGGTEGKVAATLEAIIDVSPNYTGGDGYYSDLRTMPLLSGSVARNQIPEDSCGLTDDARGESRPDFKSSEIDGGPFCDVGAYEYTVLDCSDDAQRRYEQGETFVKYCGNNLEDIEVGSINPWMLTMLSMMGLLSLLRMRQA